MSTGPADVRDGAASLSGFVRVGGHVYAMNAFHACRPLVTHPATWSYCVGNVAMCTPLGTLRPSLTFEGGKFAPERTMGEMDWCLIGPAENRRNVVSVPRFHMDRCVAVEKEVRVEGNTEVYAMARTSGYSLGFTSDVPGRRAEVQGPADEGMDRPPVLPV